MFSEEILYAIALKSCPMIGDGTFRKLVEIAGSAKEAWMLSRKEIHQMKNISRGIYEGLGDEKYLKRAEQELKFCEDNEVGIFYSVAGELPGLLGECADAPALLYYRGTFHANRKNISMVGTRDLTNYGSDFIRDFLGELRHYPLQTVSGLALGADSKVHRESIANELPTVAVVAHGLHMLYPPQNQLLAKEILENGGCILTEYPSTHKLHPTNFIERNRIIAGISPVTIVVESGLRGGSLSTATFANNYNREVLALPGDIHHPKSKGCNLLIVQNKARIIAGIPETISYLGFNANECQLDLFAEVKDYSVLNTEQQRLIKLIQGNPAINLDDLALQLELPSYKILPILLELELMNYIRTTSAKQYFVC